MSKILIVEDDKNISSFISTILLGAGYVCFAASTAARARDLLNSEPEIALVLLDQHLGESCQSGLALLTEIRQSPKFQHLPIIVCSGDSRPTVVAGFLGQRVMGFLRKPFKADRMLADVQRALGHGGNAISAMANLAQL
jgi:DNA-binding NtrC family response regulator